MEFKVRLFLGDQLIDPSDYDKVIINCPDVDRIVNEIYERNQRRPLTLDEIEELEDELGIEPDEPPPVEEKGSLIKKLHRNQALVKERETQRAPQRASLRENAR